MNIVVTGSSGFVGINLVPYLMARDETAIPLTRSEKFAYASIDANFLNEKKANAIVHLAGKAHDLNQSANPEEYYLVNTNLTIQLFDAFIQSAAEVFIYISSVKAVADHANLPLTEDMVPSPVTDYGKSKLAAEQYLLSQALPDGKRVYILRPCMIHGPGNKGNLNLLYQLVRKGIPYPLAAFDNRRSFLSIENLCFVIHTILNKKEIPTGIYHVCDNDPLSTNFIVQLISKVLHKKPRLIALSPRIIKFVAALGDRLPIPLNSQRLQKLTENYLVSNQKLCQALQQSLPVAAKEGLEKTIASFTHVH